MISTLRANNGTFASLGNITLQAVVTTATQALDQLTATHVASPAVPPARQAPVSQTVLLHSPDNVTRLNTPTLSQLAQHLTTGSPVVIALRGPRATPIVPTYNLAMIRGREYDIRANQGFVATTTKFQPYEQLTGISQERPEVVMVTNFEPLFYHDVVHTAPHFLNYVEAAGVYPFMTPVGQFINEQFNIRNIRTFNTQRMVKVLKDRYPLMKQLFDQRNANFNLALDKLNVDTSFLLNLVRIIEAQKAQLDLRHDIYRVVPNVVANLLTTNYVQSQAPASLLPVGSSQQPASLNRHKPQYDLAEVLTDLGYKQDTVQNVYSSTKVWMQLLLELSYALKFHTLQFIDIDPHYQKADTNPSSILDPKVTRFSLSTNLPTLPPLVELISLQPSNAQKAIDAIKPAFTTIYQNVLFQNEEARIAALAHLLVAEYRYSYGLTLPAVLRVLSDYYGYKPVTGFSNVELFNSIVGRFGNNITDFPKQATNALVSVAQQTSNQTGVLTFESKYVEGDTGTLTPGGDFYFDQLMQITNGRFNTANIDSLVTVLENASNAFNIVVDGFNLMANPNSRPADGVINVQGTLLQTTNDLLSAIKSKLVDANGTTSQMLQTDRLASVFAHARKNSQVKASLFLYVLSKVSRTYNTLVPFFASSTQADNTPLVDYLVGQVNIALETSVPFSRSSVQYLSEPARDRFNANSPFALNPQGVASALKSGTPLTEFVIQLMGQIIAQFKQNTQAIKGDFTLYSGYLDTIVMMVAFDLITSMIARYGNLNIVGVTSGVTSFSQCATSYVVSQTTMDHRNAVNELSERALGEDTRVQQMVMAISNTLTTLGGSLKGVSNYLNTPSAISRLQDVADMLGNDKQMLSMLLSEQQIMLLASTVSNLLSAMSQGLGQQSPSNVSATDVNAVDEIKILDESAVPPALKNAMLGYFGSADFASTKGSNKRILTVGIPQGFTQRIKQKVNIQNQQRASFQNKRNDIVQICVYKVDMVNSDIIYKPQRFLFELSRFPVRVTTVPWLPLPDLPSTADVINAVPTLCFSQNADASASTSIFQGIEYASATVAGNDGIKNVKVALDGDKYSFLSQTQKTQLLQNHVASQLLEAYVRLMTGINVAEYNFDMVPVPGPVEANMVKTVTEHVTQHTADIVSLKSQAPAQNPKAANAVAGGILFSTTATQPLVSVKGGSLPQAIASPQLTNPAGVSGFASVSSLFKSLQPSSPIIKSLEQTAVVGNVDANLSVISPKQVPLMIEQYRTVSSFANTLSSVSDPTALYQKVITPKQFDRVFNIIVDPTDFEVDVDMTIATPYGKEALDLMIQNGEIVPMTENDQTTARATPSSAVPVTPGSRPFTQGRAPTDVNKYRYRDRDVNQGDLIADKYFITVETLDEEAT